MHVAILCGDDEELVAVLAAVLDEGLAVCLLSLDSIEPTTFAVAGRAVALRVVDMGIRCPAAHLKRAMRALMTTRRMRSYRPTASADRPLHGPDLCGSVPS